MEWCLYDLTLILGLDVHQKVHRSQNVQSKLSCTAEAQGICIRAWSLLVVSLEAMFPFPEPCFFYSEMGEACVTNDIFIILSVTIFDRFIASYELFGKTCYMAI